MLTGQACYDDKGGQLTRFVSVDRRALLDFVVTHWLRTLEQNSKTASVHWLETANPERIALVVWNSNKTRKAEFLPAIAINRSTRIIYGRKR